MFKIIKIGWQESSSSYVWNPYNGLPSTKFVIKNEEGATYTINGGTIEATNTCTAVLNNGEVIVNDGIIKIYNYCYGIVNYQGDAQIIVNGGLFEDYNTKSATYGDTAYLISSFNEGNIKINGGKFYGSIDSRSSKVYQEGVSEPALYITNGEFYKAKGKTTAGSIISKSGEVWVIPGTDSTIISNNNIEQSGILKVQNVNINANISNNGAKTLIENSSMNKVDISYSTSGSTYEAQIIGSTANGTIIARNSGNVLIKDSTTKEIDNTGPGTMEIENCTVNEYLYNSSTGTIKISDVGTTTITGSNFGIYNYGAGTILIPGGNVTITATSTSSSGASYGIYNNNSGTIVIGTKGGTPSTTSPRIKGGKYGIYNTNSNSQINFYDGIIIGKTDQAIYGKINEIEEGYSIVLNNVDSTQEATLQRLSILKTLKTNINTANLSGIEYKSSEDGNYYEFYSIQDAANASTNNTNTEFIAMRDISIAANFATQTIPENKDITIDLAGYKLDSSKEQAIVNKGKLTFIDSSAESVADKIGSILVNQKDFIINEEGSTLNLNAIKLKLNTRGNSSEYNYIIKNDGTANLTNVIGDMEDTSYCTICENTGIFNANGGKYTQSDSNDESRFIENKGEAVATISNSTLTKVDVYNYDEATMKLIDTELESRITNESPKVFEEGVSEPAVRITGCTIDLVGYSGRENSKLTAKTSNGEMLFENNEETGKKLTIIEAPTNGTLKTATNGIISINSGEILGHNAIDNGADGIVNIRNGYLEGVNITNKGELNIGTNDSTIISYTDLQYDEENNIIKDIGAPIINRKERPSFSNTGIINFYDGVIASEEYFSSNVLHDEVITGTISEIPTNAEIIYSKFETYNTYSLSKTTPVAKIGTTEYTTLQAAINACNSTSTTEIIMLESIAVPNGYSYDLGDKKIKLDMNGNTIFSHDILHDESQRTNILFTTAGEFEIADTSEEQTAKIYSYFGGIVKNSGELKISGCSFTIDNTSDMKNEVSATIIENIESGTVDMTGGKLNTYYYFVNSSNRYSGYGIYSTSTCNVTVTGGVINVAGYSNPNSYAIFVNNSDDSIRPLVTIGGDAIIHKLNDYGSYGFEVENCNVKITGGNNDANNRMTNSDAIVSGGITSGTTTIYDKISTLTMNNSNATMGGISNKGKVTVTAGNITGSFDNNATKTSTDDIGMFISGANITGKINNYGTATVENSTLTGTAYLYISGGTMKVNGVTINGTATDGINLYSGTVDLYNSTIVTSKEASANPTGLYVRGGTLNIPYYTEDDQVNQVEVNCVNGNGLYQTGGTVTIGDLSYPVYNTYPKISGGTYGIKKTGGTLNFYDGILYGTTKAIDGTIAKMPDLYSLVLKDIETIAYLDIIPTSQGAAKIGENSNYNTIQGAINAVESYTGEKKDTIELLIDSSITETITIPSTVDVTIDLHGHTIRGANEDNPIIVNYGKLTIIDSATTATSKTCGYIQNLTGIVIENQGTLEIGTDDDTMLAKAPKIFGGTYGIDTTEGTLTIYDGTIEGVIDAVDGILLGPSGYVITDGTETLNANTDNEMTYRTKYLVSE